MNEFYDVSQIAQRFDGARLVRVNEQLRQMAVWHGGVTINIYDSQTLNEITCFSLSDEKGRAEDADTVDQHIDELFDRHIEELSDE